MTSPRVSLLDTHVHLDCHPLRSVLDEEIRTARAAGVKGFVIPGITPADWSGLMDTAARIPGVLAAPGVHPLAAASWCGSQAARLEELLARGVAVGEIGLDGSLSSPARLIQERAFREQLQLAVATGRPVLVHCRQAIGRVLEILAAEGAQRVGGIFHAFSGSIESARKAIRLNFAIGIGGTITFANARRGPELLRQLPDDWLVLETDAPDQAPEPHRGAANRPAYLPLIASRVAELRGCSYDEIAQVTTANALRVLGLPNHWLEGLEL